MYQRLRHSAVASDASVLLLLVRVGIGRARGWPAPRAALLKDLVTALRRVRWGPVRTVLEAALRLFVVGEHADVWRVEEIGWERVREEIATAVLPKSLILKAPGPAGEKGVLYVSFEVNWLRLMAWHDLPAVLETYDFVGASSWSPPDYAATLALATAARDAVFIQISNRDDLARYRVCSPRIRALPLMACDWINPNFYAPRPHADREIDLLMVAGWAEFKGHALLFRALRQMDARLRVVLIGQDMDGRTADDVWREARAFGVAGRVELLRDAPPALVSDYQCNSRASVVLSRREGSNVVTAESFFADTPVAMLRGAHVGARAYINRSTGLLTDPRHLARDLSHLVEESARYAPRSWALTHITCFQSTARLNGAIRAYAEDRRLPWTRDIVAMCWRPDPVYVNAQDALEMLPAYEAMERQHGIRFRPSTTAPGVPSPAIAR